MPTTHPCHDCQRPMKDLGYWNGAAGLREVRYRCVNPACSQTSVKPFDSKQTTWTALRLI